MTEPNWPEKCNVSLEPGFKRGCNEAIDACKKAYDEAKSVPVFCLKHKKVMEKGICSECEAKGQELVPLDEYQVAEFYANNVGCNIGSWRAKNFAKKICSTFATPKPRACDCNRHPDSCFTVTVVNGLNMCPRCGGVIVPKPRAGASMEDIREYLYKITKGVDKDIKGEISTRYYGETPAIAQAIHKLLSEEK